MTAGRAPGRHSPESNGPRQATASPQGLAVSGLGPKPARASRETRLALQPSKPAQAGLEPRLSFPAGDRPMVPSDEGLH